jgi:hypothetical protein
VKIGCADCHVPRLTTAPAGTVINGGTFTIPPALGGKTFHPYGDFLLHEVGTGDGIVMAVTEHYGRSFTPARWENFSMSDYQRTQNKEAPSCINRVRKRTPHSGAVRRFNSHSR